MCGVCCGGTSSDSTRSRAGKVTQARRWSAASPAYRDRRESLATADCSERRETRETMGSQVKSGHHHALHSTLHSFDCQVTNFFFSGGGGEARLCSFCFNEIVGKNCDYPQPKVESSHQIRTFEDFYFRLTVSSWTFSRNLPPLVAS